MKTKIFAGCIWLALFAGLIFLLGVYDTAAIGPDGTTVGFSTVNSKVHELTGLNMRWYDITDMIGYFALGVCALFGLAGLIQLIKRKSLFKVDRTIIGLGVLYAVVIGLYILFEKVIINYRPVIMPGADAPEASFPSSHTMLIITVMISAMLVSEEYVRSQGLLKLIRAICITLVVVTICGRMYCGVHWFTDIMGGMFLSFALIEFFGAFLSAGGSRAKARGNRSRDSREESADEDSTVEDSSDEYEMIDGYHPKH